MGVRMSDLARALFAAPGLGLCLFFFLLTVRFCVHLIGGVRRGRAGKWQSEVAVCLACLAVTIAMTVFLYAVNRGVLRWFLVAGTLGTLLFLEKKWGRPLRAASDRLVSRVHRLLLRVFLILSFPLRWLARTLAQRLRRVCGKIHLRLTRVCGRISVKNYDKRKRRTLGRENARMLVGLRGTRNVDYQKNTVGGTHALGGGTAVQSEP